MSEGKVYHPKYGYGVVLRGRNKGFEFEVLFESGLKRWVPYNELKGAGIRTSSLPQAPPWPVFSDERLKARRMIEAFRLGIVPQDCIEDFTFGRDEEKTELQEWLDSSKENVLLVVGGYGTGKTHFLHYALNRARQAGFAVTWIEMDPNESPFYKPKRVYGHLMRNLEYRFPQRGQVGKFRDLVREAIAKGVLKDHLYFKHLYLHGDDENLWNWIEAQETRSKPGSSNYWDYRYLLGLPDDAPAANIYCYLLSALGWAAKEVLGLRGLFMIFDEAETIDMYRYTPQERNGQNFLRALIRTANGDSLLLREPWNTGLDYSRKVPGVPFLYKEPSGLKIIFAFTSLDWNYPRGRWWVDPTVAEIEDLPKIELQSLEDDALREVFKHVCLLYNRAYGFLENDHVLDGLFQRVKNHQGLTRLFVKGSVEALDILRFHGKKSLDKE